jgi:hypothetical protein
MGLYATFIWRIVCFRSSYFRKLLSININTFTSLFYGSTISGKRKCQSSEVELGHCNTVTDSSAGTKWGGCLSLKLENGLIVTENRTSGKTSALFGTNYTTKTSYSLESELSVVKINI